MNLSLAGRHAFVGGGSQGIGRAIAMELAANGATVTIASRREASLQSTLKELSAAGGQKHSYLACDFSKPDDIRKKAEKLIKDRGEVQIFVHNTGGPLPGLLIEKTPEDLTNFFNMQILSGQILVQTFVQGMKAAKYGRIINITSTSTKQPISNLGLSNTIRSGISAWAKTLAFELGPYGITVNNVLPGATQTERILELAEANAKKKNLKIEDVVASMTEEIPAKRFAKPEEIAYAVAFLASPAAEYVSGINFPVDGGRTASL